MTDKKPDHIRYALGEVSRYRSVSGVMTTEIEEVIVVRNASNNLSDKIISAIIEEIGNFSISAGLESSRVYLNFSSGMTGMVCPHTTGTPTGRTLVDEYRDMFKKWGKPLDRAVMHAAEYVVKVYDRHMLSMREGNNDCERLFGLLDDQSQEGFADSDTWGWQIESSKEENQKREQSWLRKFPDQVKFIDDTFGHHHSNPESSESLADVTSNIQLKFGDYLKRHLLTLPVVSLAGKLIAYQTEILIAFEKLAVKWERFLEETE